MPRNQDVLQLKCAIVTAAANGREDAMKNRSEYPGRAGLLPAAVITFRIALLGLMLTLPAVAVAQDRQGGLSKPTLILSLASYEQLRSGLLYLARLAGQDDAAAQLDQLIDARTGNRGLEGIDLHRPMGAYGWVGPHGDDSTLVLLIPVADQNSFLGLLGNFNIAPRQGGDGVYRAYVENLPDPVYLRFANGYAYVTVRDEGVLDDDRLLFPGAVLTGQGCVGPADADYRARGYLVNRYCPNLEAGVLSLIVNIDRIPDEFKELVLGQLALVLAEAKEMDAPPFETEGQRKFRLASIDEIGQSIRAQLYEGGETSLRLDLDRKADEVTLTVSMAGKAGTAMAAAIRDAGRTTSTTAGLLRNDAAVNGEMSVAMLEKQRELFGALLDDSRRQALANIWNPIERMALATAFEAFMPTLNAGELDWAFNLLGPDSDGLYAFTAGVKVRDGARLEKIFRHMPAPDPTTEVTFDVDRVGPVGIHRIMLRMDDDARRAFGGNSVYLAFRDDAVFFTVGSRGLGLLKEALAVAPVMTGRVMELQIAASRLAPLAKERAAQDIARSVFGGDRDGDRLRLTLEGGDAMKLRLSMKAKLIEYASLIGRVMK
jgi:hypothetical protein